MPPRLTASDPDRLPSQNADRLAAEALLGRTLTNEEAAEAMADPSRAVRDDAAPLEGELWDEAQSRGCPALTYRERVISGAAGWLALLDELAADPAARRDVMALLRSTAVDDGAAPAEPVTTTFHIAVGATFSDAARAACETLLVATAAAFVAALVTAGGKSEEAAADLDQDDA